MKGKRKLLLAMLAVAIAACLGIACKGDPVTPPPVTPVDFADATVTASYGDDFSFASMLNVKGSDEETYRATAVVTKTDGTAVSVVDGGFRVNDTAGYKIVFTVDMGQTYTRTLTVNVVRFTLELTGYQESYPRGSVTLPTAAVKDKDGNPVEAQINYTVTNKAGEPVQTPEGVLSAPLATVYTVNYTAKFNGTELKKTILINVVRDAAAVNEIESYDCVESIEGSRALWNDGTTTEIIWLDEYEGESGVIKFDYSDNGGGWPSFTWEARQNLDAYADYDYIVVRAWFADTAGKVRYAVMGGGDYHVEPIDATGYTHDGNVDSGDYHMTYDGWKDYVYPIGNFIEAWKTGNVSYGRWLMHGDEGAGTLYIADIKAANEQDVDLTVTGALKRGTDVTLAVTADVTCDLTVVDPDGEPVTLAAGNTFTAKKAGKYYARAEYNNGAAYGLAAKEIVITAPVLTPNAYTGDTAIGSTITVPGAKLISEGTELATVDTAASVTYYDTAVTLTGNKTFTATYAGNYVVTYSLTYQDEPYTVTQTIAIERNAAAANEIESFDDPSSVENVRAYWASGSQTEITWLAEFDGENNVVKFDSWSNGGGWPSYTWTPRHDLDDYADYDYIVVRAWFADCDGKIQYACMGGGDYHIEPIDATGYVHDGNVSSGDYHINYGGWKNYVYPIENFINAWKAGGGLDKWMMHGETEGANLLYISSIYAATKQDIAVTGGDNVTVNEEIELTVTAGGVDYVLTVVDPDGEPVTVTANKFTPTKAGKYYVRAEYVSDGVTIYGLGTAEITVKAPAELQAKEFTGTAVVGSAITVPGAELMVDSEVVATVDTAVSVTFGGTPVTLTENKTFTPDKAGAYVVNYSVEYEDAPYTTTQTITVARKAAAANEIESFDDPSSVENVRGCWNDGNSVTKTWLSEYDGETNVVKLEFSDNGGCWPSFTWTPRHDLDDYADYDYIVVRAWFGESTGKVTRAVMGGGDYHIEPIDATGYVHDGNVNSGDYHFVYDGWKNYVYPIENFINAWKTGNVSNGRWLMVSDAEGSGVLYISSIYAATKQDITVTGGDDATVNEEIELTVTAGGVDYVLTVVDPDGEAVTVTANKFTPTKAGKYYVRAEYVAEGVTVYGLGAIEIEVSAAT